MNQPKYQVVPLHPLRKVVPILLQQHRPHTSYGMTEIDVTTVLEAIRQYQRKLRIGISFNAYIVYCLAQVTQEYPLFNAYRQGDKLIFFEDVDVTTTLEKRLPNGQPFVMLYTVNAAQSKTFAQINWELRQVMKQPDLPDNDRVQLRRRFLKLPHWIQAISAWYATRNPFWHRRLYGTIGLTNLSQNHHRAYFGLPTNTHTLTLATGSITDRTILNAQGEATRRKMLCLSAGMDHAVVDGMEAARFNQRLTQLIEAATGLDDSFFQETYSLLQDVSA